MDPVVEFDCVSFRYSAEPVLVDIDLHLHPGQFAALVGPNTRALASPATTPTLTAPIDGAVVGGLVPLGATSSAPALVWRG